MLKNTISKLKNELSEYCRDVCGGYCCRSNSDFPLEFSRDETLFLLKDSVSVWSKLMSKVINPDSLLSLFFDDEYSLLERFVADGKIKHHQDLILPENEFFD